MQVREILLDEIELDPAQPRKNFDREKLDSLARSIQEVGQLQPVVVAKKENREKKYLLVAGERRYRAARKLGLETIAAVIVKDKDYSLKQIQLIENLQREDLDPLEKALSIKKFMEEEGLNKTKASKKLGIPRTTLTEWLNILDVSEKYRQAVVDNYLGKDSPLTLSHISLAKALAHRMKNPQKKKELLDAVLKYGLNRKETRELVDLHQKNHGISMEEAVSAILMRREKSKGYIVELKQKKCRKEEQEAKLYRAFCNLNSFLEEYLEQKTDLSKAVKEKVIDEYIYLYQLLKLIIPDIEQKLIESGNRKEFEAG